MSPEVMSWDYLTDERIATGCDDGVAALWQGGTGRLLEAFEGHGAPVTIVKFLGNELLATGTDDHRVHVWSIVDYVRQFRPSDRPPVETFLLEHDAPVSVVCCSVGGTRLMVGLVTGDVVVWNMRSGEIVSRFSGHAATVRAGIFSLDDRLVLTGSDDLTACLWNSEDATALQTFRDHDSAVVAVGLSPDARFALTGTSGGVGCNWEVATGQEIARHDGTPEVKVIRVHNAERVYMRSCRRSGPLLLDYGGVLWDVRSGRTTGAYVDEPPLGLAGRELEVYGMFGSWNRECHLDGHQYDIRKIPWWNGDGTSVDVLSTSTNGEVELVYHGSYDFTESAAISPDGKLLLLGHGNGCLSVWEVASGRQVDHRRLVRCEFAGDIPAVAWSPDGRSSVAATEKGYAVLLRQRQEKELRHAACADHDFLGVNVAFAPDGRSLVTTATDGSVIQWDADGNRLRQFAHPEICINAVAFMPSKPWLLTGAEDGVLHIWSLESSSEIGQIKAHYDEVDAISVGSNGVHVATGSTDGSVRLWDLDRRVMIRDCRGHARWVSAVAISADGQFLLSGAQEESARLWDLRSGTELRRFDDCKGPIAFMPDGVNALIVGCSVRIVNLRSGAVVRVFKV